MRKPFFTGMFLLMFLGLASKAPQSGSQGANGSEFIGTWSGSWEMGASSGGFELTLEKDKDGKIGGRVSVTGEPTYKATLRTVAFDGKKMNAVYDFPPDDQAEVALMTTFDGNTAKGTWSLRVKGGGAEVASGTWTVTKN